LNAGGEELFDDDVGPLLHTNQNGNPGRNSAAVEDDLWWVVYLQAAFQAGWKEDCDPDDEVNSSIGVCPGHTDTLDQGSLMFLETIRDLADPSDRDLVQQQTVVHELGHQFGLAHAGSEHSIMTGTWSAVVPPDEEHFLGWHIKAIRDGIHSPGQ
jgi:hypothetical protein